jgi:heat shock protein HtpX
MNTFKSTLLLVALMLVLVFVGGRFGGQNGMILAFVISVAMNFTAYFYSDKIALAMYRAQPVTREELPRAYEVVERLTAKQGLPMPKIYVLPTESPNAFATGRNPQHASVAVTHGILGLLDDEELEGVLAHELGHVKNRDILTSSIAATLAGAITLIARMGYYASLFGGFGGRDSRDREGGGLGALLMLIVAPVAATLIQLAVSRSREYEADATGAHTTGNPFALARALQKLENYSKRVPLQATPATAHLFIIAPLIGGGIGSLFSTHPPTKERIRRLIGRDLV